MGVVPDIGAASAGGEVAGLDRPIALTGDSSIRGYILSAWRAIGPVALESAHPSYRPRILAAWEAIGKPALTSMERVKRAMVGKTATDKLAGEYAKAIEETITALKGK